MKRAVTIGTLILTLSCAPCLAHISCAVKAYDESLHRLTLTCPPPAVFAPLRLELWLTGKVSRPAIGSLCKFSSNNGLYEMDYKDVDGHKNWLQLDKMEKIKIIEESSLNQ